MKNRLGRRRILSLDVRHSRALPARVHVFLLDGPSRGGPSTLAGGLLAALLDIERRGLHTVLVAAEPADLDTPVAAVCRYVLAADVATLAQARAIWGSVQVISVASVSRTDVIRGAQSLPRPASCSLMRRVQTALRAARRNLASRHRGASQR